MPVGADLGEVVLHLLVAAVPHRPDVVEEDAHGHAALHGALEGVEEWGGGVVVAHGVEEHVDVALGLVDLVGHAPNGAVVGAVQLEPVAVGERDRGEVLAELRDLLEPGRTRDGAIGRRDLVGGVADDAVDLGLHASPAGRQLVGAEQEEQDDAEVRDEDDRDDPREGRRGAPVAGDDNQRRHDDEHVEGRDGREPEPGEPELRVPGHEGASGGARVVPGSRDPRGH